jgi:formylglycine-generating enzyme required for sulfatase activity
LHRDVKPSNIMLSSDLRVLLMDFGLVREEEPDSDLTQKGQMIGTPAFMSPEQCQCKVLDRRSDIYSLGGTMYWLLTGKLPFQGTMREVIAQIVGGNPPLPAHRLNPLVPAEVDEVLGNAMAWRPQDRFATAAVMAKSLKSLIRSVQPENASVWRSEEISSAAIEAHHEGELPAVELLPLETRWESLRGKMPWVVAAAAAMAVLLALAVTARFLPPEKKAPPVPTTTSTSKPVPTKEGMVFIEAGMARLCDDETKLREFLGNYLAAERVENVIKFYHRQPQSRVPVPAFWIDQYEVTNSQYARFLRDTGRSPPKDWKDGNPPAGKDDHPVVGIGYEDADAYARWAGKLLPTQEQWMRAFRGDHDWLFPWGDQYDAGRANVYDNPKFPSTSAIHDTPRDVSPFQVYNMAGNVNEFVRGWAEHDGESCRLCKGAQYATQGFIFGIGSCEFFLGGKTTDKGTGFRCVREQLPLP